MKDIGKGLGVQVLLPAKMKKDFWSGENICLVYMRVLKHLIVF